MPDAARRLANAMWNEPYLLLGLTALFWAGNAVAGRAAVGEVSPFLLTFLRWFVVAGVVVACARNELAAAWPTLKGRLAYLFVMGVVGFTAFNTLFYVAAHTTTAVNLGIIQGAMPVFVMLGAFLVFGTRIVPVQALGVGVTLVGVVIVATAGDVGRLLELTFRQGDLLMLLASLFYAGYAVFLRKKPDVPGLVFFGALAISALIASLPMVAWEAATGRITAPSPVGWAIVAYVALFPSFLAQIFFIRGVELIGAGRAGVFVNLLPVFAPLLAVAILGEALEVYHLVALALVLGGIWMAERGRHAI